MDKQRQDLRHVAAQAFLESLANLEETLHVAPPPAAPPPVTDRGNHSTPPGSRPESAASSMPSAPLASSRPSRKAALQPFSLADFEQAAADIERYMQSRQSGLAE